MNEFDTIEEAIEEYNRNPEWAKKYWDSFTVCSACVIEETDGKYWIITHPNCVEYRRKKNQIVAYLN